MRRSFFVLIGAFLLGVLWRSLAPVGLPALGTLLAMSVVLWFVLRAQYSQHALYALLASLACVGGVVRTELAWQSFDTFRVYHNGERIVAAEGIVRDEPDVRDRGVVLVVDRTDTDRNVRFRMTVPRYPTFHYGDRVQFAGTVREPVSFESDTGRVFDYAGYLRKDGVHYVLDRPTVSLTAHESGFSVRGHLIRLKHAWMQAVSQTVPEPEAALAAGIIVGGKQSLSDSWMTAFRTTGLVHIVVLSGYNLTIVANGIVRALGFLPRLVGLWFGAAGILGFALMTGAGSTVARASIMALIGMVAVHGARTYDVLRALALACFIMVLWSPFILVSDPGFQLSFVATVGLILFSPLIAERLHAVPERWQLREIVAATLATQLTVLPLLLYQVGSVSLIAPFTNIIALPIIPVAMAIGFAAGLVGMVSTTIALPCGWIVHALLSFVLAVVHYGARVPFASLTLPPVHWLVVVLLYLFMSVGYYVLVRHRRAVSVTAHAPTR